MLNLRRRAAAFLAAILTMIGILVAGTSPAQADTYPYWSCNYIWNSGTSYAYGSGSSAIYATNWIHYGEAHSDAAHTWASPCIDINVQTDFGHTTGAMTVRTQFCPNNAVWRGVQPIQFSCYTAGWGTLTPFSCCDKGTSAHWYQFPSSTNFNWLYRVESLGSAEALSVIE